jgi:aspartyl-tRNA(Asn)/glutamyl-tRNA(Gln) amidotransferase subunit A
MVGSDTLDKIGPMARSAEDAAAVLEAIAGPDPADPSTADEPFRAGRGRSPRTRLRGAIVTTDFASTPGAEPEVGAAFDEAVRTLRGMDVALEEAPLPDLPASEVTTTVLYAEAISALEPYFRDGSVKELTDVYAPHQEEITRPISGSDYVKAMRMRRVMQEAMADLFRKYDVIVAPNFLSVAPPIAKDFYETLPYPDPVGAFGNGCGLPAIALPCGFGRGRMPVGFQIMASAFEEDLLVELGARYQKRTGWHLEKPPAFAG